MSHQYKYIKGKELLGRVAVDFTIDTSQWIHSAPLWIADALAQLKIINTFQYATKEVDVVGHRCELPCNLKLLIAVEYDGRRLRRLGVFNNMSADSLLDRGYSVEEGYELVGDNWITTTFEEGTIIYHYRVPAADYDKVNDVLIPKIPDDPYVIEALKWYIILHLLYKGFKHPVFDLNSNNEFTNPGLQWEKNKKRARNSVNIIDADEREQISLLFRKFLQDYSSYDQVFFAGEGTGGSNYGELTLMESVTCNSSTTIVNNVTTMNKYSRFVINEDSVYIPATTHGLGTTVIPTFYLLIGADYVQAEATFEVDILGNITWSSESIIANGLIVLV